MSWPRVTRYSIGVTMPLGHNATAAVHGLVEACEQIPSHVLRSITFDQGSEWAEWAILAASYNIDRWFCDPHPPWQRGQIENLNRQWRLWFARGTCLDTIALADADHTASTINGQRRLHNHSPVMRHAAATASVH